MLSVSALRPLWRGGRGWCSFSSSSKAAYRSQGRRPLLDGTGKSYEQLYAQYKTSFPTHYNMGIDICDKHVFNGHGDDVALIYHTEDRVYTFNHFKDMSDRFGNALRHRCGVQQGDRVGILLPQCPETAVTHISTYKLGAITLPLFTLFGPEAVQFRLADSSARVVVTDAAGLETLQAIPPEQLPALEHIVVVRSEAERSQALPSAHIHDFYQLLEASKQDIHVVNTTPEDPALIIYTSGTTGNPKGCLHAHRVLMGHLPGVELPHRFFPQENDLFWTPADWAWIGGLLDVLMPSWAHRVPVLAHRSQKFDPDEVFFLLKKYNVRNTFMPATALRIMRAGAGDQTHQLRSLGSGGETLGRDLIDWGKQAFGTTINEFYGQTECNLILANCDDLFPVRTGSMGKPVPGKIVAIVDEQGKEQPAHVSGHIAVKRPADTMFLRYWGLPEATAAKFRGDWLITGDEGYYDDDGYFFFKGREDDVICSAGYRIGPSEIEECVCRHDSVALCAAIGKPDKMRTEIVKVFVVLKKGVEGTESLKKEIKAFVKERLAAHEYPRDVEFVHQLPMTTTGKVIRKQLKQMEIERSK